MITRPLPRSRLLKVLVVDDDADVVALERILLEARGHTVFTVTNGAEALAFLGRQKVDLILLDIQMPQMDGLAVLETMRRTSDALVLMVTGFPGELAIQWASMLGADDYILKPFTAEQLLSRIERLVTSALPSVPHGVQYTRGRFALDRRTALLRRDGQIITLTPLEAQLLECLFTRPDMRASSEELFAAGWVREAQTDHQMHDLLQVAMERLQAKIEDDPAHPRHLVSDDSGGFRFDPD